MGRTKTPSSPATVPSYAAAGEPTSRGGGLPSSDSHCVTQNNRPHHGLSDAVATSNTTPVALNAIHLDANCNEPLDLMLNSATLCALRAPQDGSVEPCCHQDLR